MKPYIQQKSLFPALIQVHNNLCDIRQAKSTMMM